MTTTRVKLLCVIKLSLLLVTIPCAALNPRLLLPNDSMDHQHFLKLLQQIKLQRDFQTLFVLRQHQDDCDSQVYLQESATPVLLLGANQGAYLKSSFNSEVLVIVCVSYFVNEGLIEKLAENLHRMRNSRVLFMWKQSSANLPDHMQAIRHIVQLCQKHEIQRVAIFLRDFASTLSYYSHQQFPQVMVVSRSLAHPTSDIFPVMAKNMYGHKIFTATDWIEPRFMRYFDENGKKHITGYLAKLVLTFAKKVNATLHFPPLNRTVFNYLDLLQLTRNKTIDFAASLSSPKMEVNPEEYTYPVEITAWRPMLPMAPQLKAQEIYFHIIDRDAILLIGVIVLALSALTTAFSPHWSQDKAQPHKWLQLLINSKSLRAMLGQGFALSSHYTCKHRFSMLLLLFAGFMVSNMYSAYLSSNLTHLPYRHAISSFDDLLLSSRKIMITKAQQQYLRFTKGESFWQRYERCFVIETPVTVDHLRGRLNTSFGYSVLSSLWSVIEQQQQYYGRRLFRISPHMYFDEYYLAAMPIRENSFLKDELNLFISQVISSGLMSYWKSMTFIDMLKAGRASMTVRSDAHVRGPMRPEDLYWICVGFLLAQLTAVLVFGLELLVFKWRKRRASRRGQQHSERRNRRLQ